MNIKNYVLSAALFSAFSLGSAHAQEVCGTFSVITPLDARDIEVIEANEDQVTVGDARIGHSVVFDPQGEEVGSIDWETAVLAGSDDENLRMSSEVIMTLQTGSLYIKSSAFSVPNRGDGVRSTIVTEDVVLGIVGGTGVFEGATGTYSFDIKDNRDFVLIVDANCH